MLLTNEQKQKIQSYIKSFKHNTGIENYDGSDLIEKIEHSRFDRGIARNDLLVTRTGMMEEFSRIYKSELLDHIIPTAAQEQAANGGIHQVGAAYEYMMQQIYDNILPQRVKDELPGNHPEYERHSGMSEEEYDAFIDQAMEGQKKLFLKDANYLRLYQADEEKKESRKHSNVTYIYKTKEEKRKDDVDLNSADELSSAIGPTKDFRDRLKAASEGRTPVTEDQQVEFTKKFENELESVATQYMLVREKYNHLTWIGKWLTPTGLTLGSALRETRAVFNEINTCGEKLFGQKFTENVSDSLHSFAMLESDYKGETNLNEFKEQLGRREQTFIDETEIDPEEDDVESFDEEPEDSMERIAENQEHSIN